MNFSELAGTGTLSSAEPRRAALLLHALSAEDRRWILQQMPEVQRQALQALLSELKALGIPPDKASLEKLPPASDRQHSPGQPQAEAPREESAEQTDLMALDTAGVASLALAWRAQPALLVAQALCLRPWPWRAALLERLPALQRQRVMDRLGAPGGCPRAGDAMATAMLECMREHCRAAEGSAAQEHTKTGTSAVARNWPGWWPRRTRGQRA
ncbi:hypothetical protein [Paracidovorax konjaci]|uniref:Uncharacterized protein n=1 Tax=Paracidovorax konjaci TaxID=32040 RepID=A0A1I1WED0_9BURK|nr:hypothetical protein [Paracidovorax konjaci]SFD93497.1 hypothetical protein SAMN04489710_10983 [Paracidovorax konjaci]